MPIADRKEYRDKFLKCPFCLAMVDEVETITAPFGNDLDGGRCMCGAVYVCDRTGKNLGESYSDAIAMAFDWDYDAAFEDETQSYEEALVRYNSNIGKYLLGDGSKYDRFVKYVFIRRVRPDQEA